MKTSLMMMVIPLKPKWLRFYNRVFGCKLATLRPDSWGGVYVGLIEPIKNDRRQIVYYTNNVGDKRVGLLYGTGRYRSYVPFGLDDVEYELSGGIWEEYKHVETIEINKRAKWQHSLDTSLARAAAAGTILVDGLTVAGGVLAVILGCFLIVLLLYRIMFTLMM